MNKMPLIDTVIDELENNTNQKKKVRAVMDAMYGGQGVSPKKVNYEDVRAILHGTQDRIGDDLIVMAGEPGKYTKREMETIYGWFEWVCWLEKIMCDKENRHILITAPDAGADVVILTAPDTTEIEAYYTDDPIDEEA